MKTTSTITAKEVTNINFFEGSYLYATETTSLRVTEGYLQFKLAKQFEYRPTDEALWCEVITTTRTDRYVLDYHNNTLNLVLSY